MPALLPMPCFTRIINLASLRVFLYILVFGFTAFIGPNAQGDPLPGANDFQKVPIATGLANAVDFEFAPDGRIFILNRYGVINIYKPNTQTIQVAAQINVYHGIEAGIIGIALDPQFELNNFIYLYYSPLSPSVNRLSRFHVNGDSIDLGSEIIMLEVPVDRQGGHHDGGNLEFDQFGNLYLGTGDDTYPSNYAPLNETDFTHSAEKSSANTNDLRGKILRIHPEPDGSYSIPNGNLFTGTAEGRPEVYVMGTRNPYKFSIDSATNWLFWGDIGPDANQDSVDGPSGKDEINRTEMAGNYGWPYFIGPNLPYRNTYLNYYFDPLVPTNDSQWNTGLRELPSAQPAWITVPRAAYMVGPVYHFDTNIVNAAKLPQAFDGHLFYWNFNSGNVWYIGFDATTGDIIRNEPWDILAGGQGYIDFEIGPDHQLYVLEYGTGCCALDVGNGVLSRLDYVGETFNLSPIAMMSADNRFGSLPLTVNFSSAGTYDPDGDPFTLNWDFETDGIVDATSTEATHTYMEEGIFNAQLKVVDTQGAFSVANMTIHAGNNIADIGFSWPPEGGMFEWSEFVDVSVYVNDVEDGSIADGGIACTDVKIVPALGHLDHTHDVLPISNCETTVQFDSDHNTNGEDDLYYQFQASYLDNNGLESFKIIKAFPKRVAVEFNDGSNAVQLIQSSDVAYGARNAVRALGDQSFIVLKKRSLSGINGVSYRVASGGGGGNIELRLDAQDGPILGTVPVLSTGGYDNWVNVQGDISDPGGTHDLYLVFRAADPSATDPFDIVYVEFLGAGISYRTPPELNSLIVEPISRQVSPGNSVQFNATAYDQYDNVFNTAVGWSVSGGGSIDSNGLFTASGPEGIYDVTAQSGPITASAKVIVGDVNLALGVPVVVSSAERADLLATYAADGNVKTRWSSAFSDPQWIYVDLGAFYTIDRVVLNQETAYFKGYEIQVSDDAQNWVTVFSEGNGDGGVDVINFAPVNARYVRVLGLQRGTQWGYSLWEFEVYGASASAEPAVLTSLSVTPAAVTIVEGASQGFTATALDQYGAVYPTPVSWSVDGGGTIDGNGVFTATTIGGPFTVTATAGSLTATAAVTVQSGNAAVPLPQDNWSLVYTNSEHPGYEAIHAFDGDPNTLWHTNYDNPIPHPHEIQISLGGLYNSISGFRYLPRQDDTNARIKQYAFYVSTDGINWGTPVATGTFPDSAAEQQVLFTPTPAAFIRLVALSANDGSDLSTVGELNVLGDPGSIGNQAPNGSIASPTADRVINIGDTLDFTATATDPDGNLPLSYQWSFGAGSGVPDSTDKDPGLRPVQQCRHLYRHLHRHRCQRAQ